MNRALTISLLLFFFALTIGGEIARRMGWPWPEELSIVGGVFCIAFIHILLWENIVRNKRTRIKFGSESLPPLGDIAEITVAGMPLLHATKIRLLQAMAKAERAGPCGKPLEEIPFQIHDRWGGSWDFLAYKDDRGNCGFAINRVYYSGRKASLVAECIGVR